MPAREAETHGTGRWLAADPARRWELATVAAVARDTPTATVLELRLDHDARFLAGQYFLVRLATSGRPGAVERAYSVASSPFPASPALEIVVREVSGGRASPRLARDVRAGDLLQVRGPFGFLTWSEEDGGPLTLAGAGSGVAPLLSIVRYEAARGAGVPTTMLCSSRDRSTVLFREQLEGLARAEPWLSVVHTFTRDPRDAYAHYHRRVDASMIGEVALRAGGGNLAGASFLVAGPAGFVGTVRSALDAAGEGGARVYSEDHT